MLKNFVIIIPLIILSGCTTSSSVKDGQGLNSIVKSCNDNIMIIKDLDAKKHKIYLEEYQSRLKQIQQYKQVEKNLTVEARSVISPLHIQRLRQLCFTINNDLAGLLIKQAAVN